MLDQKKLVCNVEALCNKIGDRRDIYDVACSRKSKFGEPFLNDLGNRVKSARDWGSYNRRVAERLMLRSSRSCWGEGEAHLVNDHHISYYSPLIFNEDFHRRVEKEKKEERERKEMEDAAREARKRKKKEMEAIFYDPVLVNMLPAKIVAKPKINKY